MFFRSGILFARPSFLEGFARIFDLGGTLNQYSTSSSAQEADARAMRADWAAVGDDIRSAMVEEARTQQQAD